MLTRSVATAHRVAGPLLRFAVPAAGSAIAAVMGCQAVAAPKATSHRLTSSSTSGGAKLWGGRFTGETDALMEAFNASISFDKRLAAVDIEGSKQYAKHLAIAGILKEDEARILMEGLDKLLAEWQAGTFEIKPASDEDIHTANERRLGELVGAVAGKLHTGRSRNDQVATDVRMWLRDEITELQGQLKDLLQVLANRAEKEVDVIMPGYTHLQPAQPVR